ncbi:TPA: phosphonate ABC transporter, permease protein PhnE [Escherichia coli]
MQTITIAPPKRSWFSLLSWAVVIAVLVVSWQGAEMAPLTLIKDGGNMATFAADFFPPDFSQWQDYLTEMAVTLQIAVWGTALAVVLSIPFGLMSAENLVPWWVYQPVRRLMDACRAINEMVFAMLFVVAVGLGPFAGVLALFIHTTGVLSKLLSEAVEAIEPGPVEGIRATGANKLEEILYGVLPQVMPLLISYSLYRFESNVRSATVVGMVGAGGIGVALCLIDHYFADLTLWPTLQRFDSGSLHDFLREQTGITLRRSQTRISARRAQAKECQRLEIPNMSPLLCVRTLNHRDGESSPAEYSVSLTRADMIEFTMEH